MNRILAAGGLLALLAVILWVVGAGSGASDQPTSTSPGPVAAVDPMHPQPVAPPVRQEVGTVPPPVSPASTSAPAAPTGVVLLGTLLLRDGTPLVDARCVWSIQGVDGSVSGLLTTASDGGFRIPGPVGIRGDVPMLRLCAKWDDLDKPWGRAETAIAPTYPPGEWNVGFLEVEVLPPLVSGRVVDASGPVAGARVYALAAQVDLAGLTDEAHSERLSCLSDAEGRFAIYGRLPGGEFSLAARRSGFFQSNVVTATIGQSDVTIRVAPAGGLAGSVRLGHGLSPGYVMIEITGQPVHGHLGAADGPLSTSARPLAEGAPLHVPVAADGGFAVDMLQPGLVDCAVRCSGLVEPVAVIRGVLVCAGEVASDDRLRAIDLEHLRLLQLTLLDETGLPAEGLHVGIREVGSSRWERQITGAGGHLDVATAVGAVDVLVVHGGFAERLFPGVRVDDTLTLSRGLPVLVAFEILDQVPEFELAAQLVAAHAAGSAGTDAVEVARSGLHVIDGGLATEFRVPKAGTYEIEVTVRARGSAFLAWKFRDVEPRTIEVGANRAPRIVPAKLPAGVVGAAIARLRHLFPAAGVVR